MITPHIDRHPGPARSGTAQALLLATTLAAFAAPPARGGSESDAFTLDTRVSAESDTWVLGTGVVGALTDGGTGSLRETIATAAPGATLTFDASIDASTITLTGAPLVIEKDLTISAGGLPNGLAVSGGGTSRVIEILFGHTVNLDNLTITGGNAGASDGGGILNSSGILTITNGVLSGNHAESGGAVHNTGSTTIINTDLSGNTAGGAGGAIFNNGGFVTITRSLLTGNAADAGGAVYGGPGGDVIFVNTTLTGNSASNGGGVQTEAAVVTLIDVTVSDNSATGFGGGLDLVGAQLNIENTIVAANTGPAPGGGPDVARRASSTVVPGGANLIGDNDTAFFNFPAGPLVGTPGARLDPVLAPLGDYGGLTRTMALRGGSPAIDAGIPTFTTPSTDQRGLGFGRVRGTALDIGAYETGNVAGYDFWVLETIRPGADGTFHGDAEGDGVRNGDEYGFLLDPAVADTGLRPAPSIVDNAGNREMRVTFPIRPDADDLIYIVERSIDLANFSEIYRYDTSTGTETITSPPVVSATIDAGAGEIEVVDTGTTGSRIFWRLRTEPVTP